MVQRSYADAIASIESAGSGDYQAVGPRTKRGNRAYGRYQVMDFNIGPWTEKYLGQRLTPQEFLASPQAQDAVFEGEFGSYVQKFGNPQDAASAWFTGRPLSEGAGRSDILGTTGASYVNKFNAALGAGGNMAPQTGLLGNATISTQGQMPQQEPERLPFFQRPGVANVFDTLAMGLEGMTLNPNEGLMRAAQASMQQRREAAQTAQQRNRTVETLKQMGADPQLIQLAEAGHGQAALSEAVRRSRESTVMPAGFRTLAAQAEAAGLEPGTPEYQEFMLYGGMARESQPAGFRSLDAQARAAGFVPKSEGGGGEYENFMATAGKGLSAEAAASGRARGESAVQLSGARVAAQRALELVELLRSDEALPSMVGPIQGRAPNISAASQRFQSRLDQLQGVAFLEAYNMLRGGGQITEVEGQKAERAIARLNTAQSEEDFLQALSEFEDAVRTGVQKLEAEAGVTPTSPQTSDDPLSLRGG